MKFQFYWILLVGLSLSAADEVLKSLCEVKVECLKDSDGKKGAEIIKILYGGQQLEAFDSSLLEESETLKNMLEDCPAREHIAPVLKGLLGQLDEHKIKLFVGALKHNACTAREYVEAHDVQDMSILLRQARFYGMHAIFNACIDHLAKSVLDLDLAQLGLDHDDFCCPLNKKVDMAAEQQAIIARLPLTTIPAAEFSISGLEVPEIHSAGFNFNDTQLIVGTDNDIFVMDMASRETRKIVLKDYNDGIGPLIYNPHRSNFLVRTNDGVVYIDLAQNIQKKVFCRSQHNNIQENHVAYAPDGKAFLIETQQGGLLFDARTGERVEAIDLTGTIADTMDSIEGKLIIHRYDTAANYHLMVLHANDLTQRHEYIRETDGLAKIVWIPSGTRHLLGTTKGISILDISKGTSEDIPFESEDFQFLSLHPDQKHLLITLRDRLMIMHLEDHSIEPVSLSFVSLEDREEFMNAYYMQNAHRMCILTQRDQKVARCFIMELEHDEQHRNRFILRAECEVDDVTLNCCFTDTLHLYHLATHKHALIIDRIKGDFEFLPEIFENLFFIDNEHVIFCTKERACLRNAYGSYVQLCSYAPGRVQCCEITDAKFLVATANAIMVKEICTQKQLNSLDLHRKQFLRKALSSWKQNRPHAIATYDALNCYAGLPKNLHKRELFIGDKYALDQEVKRAAYKNVIKKMVQEAADTGL